MNILVTGGAGFIGSHLVDRLIDEGHDVLCVDNFITGSKENIHQHDGNPRFTLIEKDVSEPWPDDLLKGIERIYHLASPASPKSYIEYPIETLMVNSLGTAHLLDACRRLSIRFLLASTSEIYGDPLEHPQKETYWGHVNPNGIRSCYDESKRFAESITMVYVRMHKIDARIVRIFNTYGPRLQKDDGRVISNFLTQVVSNQDLTVYGDGSQTRSFCYVTDLVRGLITVMESEKARGSVYNLGNPAEFTIRELAERVCGLVGRKVGMVTKALPPDDPKQRQPDITKIKEELGWKPTVELEEGLQKTFEFFKEKK